MGYEADEILTSLSLNEEDSATFNGVKAKFDAYFVGSRNVIYERAKFNLFSLDRDQFEIHKLSRHGIPKMSSQTMVRSTRHRCSLPLLMLMDSLTEQAVQDISNQTEFLREL